MKKQKILILHFANLNNYGTGMMGLVTIQALADRFGSENIEIHCDFDDDTSIDEIKNELNSNVELFRYVNKAPAKIANIKIGIIRKFFSLLYLLFYTEGIGFSKIIVLGGDDLSEYYSRNGAAIDIFKKFKSSFLTKVIILGQSIGPFNHRINRLAAKYLLPHLEVYSRDLHCTEYMQNEFGVQLNQMADIALMDLPLQFDKNIENDILSKYGLVKDKYYCIVVSGLQQNDYYCDDLYIYLQRFKEIIESLYNEPMLENVKICLLAHTFPPFADESDLIQKLDSILDVNLRDKVVLVKERILQNRARFILGNGLFTITGRMHAAVSTFQMGKPAICLSYSAKYKGVIGDSIGMNDLIIECNDPKLWNHGDIVNLVLEKYHYMISNYEVLCLKIKDRVKSQRQLVIDALNKI